MDNEEKKLEIVKLLQGQWQDVDHEISFRIDGSDIVDINWEGKPSSTKYEIKWNGNAEKWAITASAFGWFNEDLFTLNETEFNIVAMGNTLVTKKDLAENKFNKIVEYFGFKKGIGH